MSLLGMGVPKNLCDLLCADMVADPFCAASRDAGCFLVLLQHLWVGQACHMPRVVPGRRPCMISRVAFRGGRQVLIAWVCLREDCSMAVLLAPPAGAASVWVPLQH